MNSIGKNKSILLGVVALLALGLALIGYRVLTTKKLDPATVTEISGNGDRTLIVTSNSELWASGWSGDGELGIVSRGGKPIKLADGVKQAVALPRSTVYLTETGELWVMGNDQDFKVFPEAVEKARGNHRRYLTKTKVLTGVRKIAAGEEHVLILRDNGELLGFGDNTFGQLGSDQLARLETIAQDVIDMFAGGDRSYYLTKDGQLFACGANGWGELGFGEWGIISFKGSNHRPIANSTPKKVADDVRSVFAAPQRTLILKNDGRLYQLGLNLDDIYSNGDELSAEPILIADQVQKMAIATIDAGDLLVVLRQDGSLYGYGGAVDELVPGASTDGWVEIASSVQDFWVTPHLFVKTTDGKMRAAGALKGLQVPPITLGDYGQLAGWTWAGE